MKWRGAWVAACLVTAAALTILAYLLEGAAIGLLKAARKLEMWTKRVK